MQSSKNFTGLIEKDIRVVLYDWFDDAIQLFCLKISIQKNYIVTVQTLTCIKKTDGINLKQSSINHRFSLSKDLGHFVK